MGGIKLKSQSELDNTCFMICPVCNQSHLRVRVARTNGNYFLACSGYPSCKHTMNLPKGLSNISMLEAQCPKCKHMKNKVHLLKLEFDSNLVNEVMSTILP